jgi:hypothetical protein
MPWHNIPREVIQLKVHLFKSLETRQNPQSERHKTLLVVLHLDTQMPFR